MIRGLILVVLGLLCLVALPSLVLSADPIYSSVTENATACNNSRKIAVGSDGIVHVVFQSEAQTVTYGYYDEAGWHFESLAGANYYPAIAIDPSGYAHVCAVQPILDGERVVVHERLPSSGWQLHEVDRHTDGGERCFHPAIDFDPLDPYEYWHVCWAYNRHYGVDDEWVPRYANDGGVLEDIPQYSYGIRYPTITIDASQRIHVAFDCRNDPITEEYQVMHFFKAGTWLGPFRPGITGNHGRSCIDMDRRITHTAHIIWEDYWSGMEVIAHKYRDNGYWWPPDPIVVTQGHNLPRYPVMDNGRGLWQILDPVMAKHQVYWGTYCYLYEEWRDIRLASESDQNSRFPQLAYHAAFSPDTLHMIWTSGEGGSYSIKYKKSPICPHPCWIAIDVGQETANPVCLSRDGYISYGELACLDIDYGYSSLTYFFDDLDPNQTYWLEVSAYHEDQNDIVQIMEIDGDTVGESTLSPYDPEYAVVEVPSTAVSDGEIRVRILKQEGEFGVAATIGLYASDEGHGGPQATRTREQTLTGCVCLGAAPNPSRGRMIISLELPKEGEISVDVYDLSGRLVNSLARGHFAAGSHAFVWRGRDRYGALMPSGVYLCQVASGDEIEIAKLVLVR